MLSVCIIVNNEEKFIGDCLSALAPLNAEIVIADSGSTDRTKEIAARYTDNIYDFEWSNDFSAARNFVISKASNDCILTVDADEMLKPADFSRLKAIEKQLLSSPGNALGQITCRSLYNSNGEETVNISNIPRMFSRNKFTYSGIVHEQLVPIANPDDNSRTYIDTGLVFDHYGYLGDEEFITRKTERNIKLLKQMCDSNPDDPYALFQLGKSYYMRHDFAKACEIFGRCLYFDLDPSLGYVQDLVTSYGYTLLNTGQYETALTLQGVYDEFSSYCEFVFMMGLVYMNNGLLDAAVNEFKKATSFNTCSIEGSNSYKAFYNIGVIYECSNNKELARQYYKKCGRYSLARQRLRKL